MRKAEKTHATLLTAAVKVFGTEGYAGATVDQIAEEAGVSKGNVYYHFKAKSDIATSVLVNGFEHILLLLQEAIKQSDSGVDALHRMITAFSRTLFFDPPFSRFMLTEIWRDDRAWSKQMRPLENECRALIERQIERGQAEGSIRPTCDVRFSAIALMSIVLTSSQYYLLEEQTGTVEEKSRQFVYRVFDFLSHALEA